MDVLLLEIAQAAIDWAHAYEEENEIETWNRQCTPGQIKSSVTARTTTTAKLQEIRRLVKEMET